MTTIGKSQGGIQTILIQKITPMKNAVIPKGQWIHCSVRKKEMISIVFLKDLVQYANNFRNSMLDLDYMDSILG